MAPTGCVMPKINALVLCALFFFGCASVPESVQRLDARHRQALHVSAGLEGGHRGRLVFWERNNGRWRPILSAPAVIGRNGFARAGEKREGDGKTPYGTYAIGLAFGYSAAWPTKLDYRPAGSHDFWIDDPASPYYNQWVNGEPPAKSFEKMKRGDNLYKLGAVIEYNTSPVVPGMGSAIFVHIWRRYDHSTAGCVAMSERMVSKVIKRLDKNQAPVIILGES